MPYYNQKEIGFRIQQLRKKKKLTQEQLAEALNINTCTIGKLECGVQGASLDLLIAIAGYFGASLDYIVLGRNTNAELLKNQIRDIMEKLKDLEDML